MYLLIIDNIEKAKQLLKTNRPLKIGDKINGDFFKLNELLNLGGDVFKKIEEEKEKDVVPSKNKLLKKSKKFKSKEK